MKDLAVSVLVRLKSQASQSEFLTFEVAIDRLSTFLKPIYQVIIKENEFLLFWSSEQHLWVRADAATAKLKQNPGIY